MTPIDWKRLDPHQPNLTREHIDARLAEVARIICTSTSDHRPDWRDLDVDANTILRPRLSRAASKAAMRPVGVKHRDGWVSFNGGRTWTPEDGGE